MKPASLDSFMISLPEAASLTALGPCLFTIAFLLLVCRPRGLALAPSLYFLSLAASFMLPLADLLGYKKTLFVDVFLLGLQSLAPAVCYLLVLQLRTGRVPHYTHWLILMAPVIGGMPFIYGMLSEERVCILVDYCADSSPAVALYHVFMACFIFLLLMAQAGRQEKAAWALSDNKERRHAYWLTVTLILLHLALPLVELGELAGSIGPKKGDLIALLLRVSFIYLVLTSLFRLYGSPLQVDTGQLPTLVRTGRKPLDDEALAEKLVAYMRHEAPYRKPSFSREELARHLKISEQSASRILNQRLGKNFNEFINEYRLEEAKQRLAREDGPINVIAYGVGFNSIASFNRVFKQMTGLSPSQYRQQQASPSQAANA